MITIHVTFSEGGELVKLYLSGNSHQELRNTGFWDNKKVYAIIYEDKNVWDFVLNAWRKL
jgi:hypothetical protein